ncbi:hypothetical protein NHG29_03095 [Aerococcaceae bacterium NML160702]|nr:hypothetical protein [Aerococcaceae bacterium NML160702]
MDLRKAIIPLAILTLGGTPIQTIVSAVESSSQVQTMSHYTLFENQEYGVSVKIHSDNARNVYNAQIELLNESEKIKEVLKNVPLELQKEEFDLLLVKLTDETGSPLIEVPSEITVQSENLRGELEKVLFLTPAAEYRTLPFNKHKSEIQFTTDKVNEFALVYKKNDDALKKDAETAKQDKLNSIVSIASNPNPNQLEDVVAISNERTSDKKSEALDGLVAISDETKAESKPELPKIDIDNTVAEKPKEEPKPQPQPEPTPPVVEPKPEVPAQPPVVDPTPEVPIEPEVEEPVTAVGDGVVHEGLPEYDLLADDDGDGFTNGSELMFNTDPSNPDSVPPLPNTEYLQGAYFLNRDSAKQFADEHVAGKERTYNIVEKTDEKGRTYFDILFSSIFVTDNGNESTEPAPAPQPDESETTSDSASETTANTPVDKESVVSGEGAVETPSPGDEIIHTPTETLNEESSAASLPEEHETLINNGYEYVGQEGDGHVYHRPGTLYK